MVTFAHTLVNDRDASAALNVLHGMIKESFFNKLRTEEQLGYVVQSYLSTHKKVEHLNLRIQSTVQDPDYLEHRINEFLAGIKAADLSSQEEELKKVKGGLISRLLQ